VWYNLKLEPLLFSQPLYFTDLGVEYVTGLHWDKYHNCFEIGYSVKDLEAYIGTMSEKNFLDLEFYDIATYTTIKC
jgi:hypothetical protein